jgi:hypothetical protein
MNSSCSVGGRLEGLRLMSDESCKLWANPGFTNPGRRHPDDAMSASLRIDVAMTRAAR